MRIACPGEDGGRSEVVRDVHLDLSVPGMERFTAGMPEESFQKNCAQLAAADLRQPGSGFRGRVANIDPSANGPVGGRSPRSAVAAAASRRGYGLGLASGMFTWDESMSPGRIMIFSRSAWAPA